MTFDTVRMSRPLKVGFVLSSHPRNPLASTRISVLNMLPMIESAGFRATVVFAPEVPTETPFIEGLATALIRDRFDIVYFQKVCGTSVLREVRALAAAGVRTIYGVCDLVDAEMTRATDMTLAVTDYLKGLYPQELHHKIRVVHDGIERPEIEKREWSGHSGSRRNPLEAVLVTSVQLTRMPVLAEFPDWLRITIVGRYARRHPSWARITNDRWSFGKMPSYRAKFEYLKFITHGRIDRVPWDPETMYTCMARADIGIIPIEQNAALGDEPSRWQLKSENRLTMKMAVGLPVIATLIPSYRPVIVQGVNGFLAKSWREWKEALDVLRSPDERRRIATAARQSVIDTYSRERQGRLLVQALEEVGRTPQLRTA